jgi:hypothetical protein
MSREQRWISGFVFHVVRLFFSDGRKYLSAAMCVLPSPSPFALALIFSSLHTSPLFLSLEISDDLVWAVDRSSFVVFVLFTGGMNERRALIPAFEEFPRR